MFVKRVRDIVEMQKMLESGTVSYENIVPILNLSDNNGGGYVNGNQPFTFSLPPLGFISENTFSVKKLYDDLRAECLAELFLKDPAALGKMILISVQDDLEYVAMKNMMQNEQRAIAVIDAIQASPKYNNAIINILQFAVIYGNDNIVNHILDSLQEFDPDTLRRFVRFLVDFSRFDIIKRLVDENDEVGIYDILAFDFWDDTADSYRISNAEAVCRYLEEMLGKLFNKEQIKQRINDEINHPYNMEHIILPIQNLDDLAKHGVTISNATLIAAAVWDESPGDFNDELFKNKIKPLLADDLVFNLCELVDFFSQRTYYSSFNISGTIIKTIELVGAERLTLNLSETWLRIAETEGDLTENSVISSINVSAVKALLKIPNFCIDEDYPEFQFIEKLTVYVPRLIIGLVKKGTIKGKVLDTVLDAAINSKNYELINQIRLVVPTE